MSKNSLLTVPAQDARRPTVGRWAAIALLCLAAGCEQENEPHSEQLIVLGFDGMDPTLCATMMDEGRLPHLAALARVGSFKRLGTSTPPQSPVAWSNLITGVNPGGHGVFDFIHRDPATAMPFSSAATRQQPDPLPVLGHSLDSLSGFDYTLPLRPETIKTNRHARPFWEYLTENDVPVHVFRMPANYPPTPSSGAHFCCLSDMGTPDVVDTLGTFSYYTEDVRERSLRMHAGGGKLVPITMDNHRADTAFVGPKNTLVQPARPATVPVAIFRDPTEAVATIRYSERDVVLKEGEWSDWQPVEFVLIPHLVTLKAMCRFYLKQVHPHLKLYVSPFNFDPMEEDWEIDQPNDWSVRVAKAVGRYYTQGLPEDTKALSNSVLSRDEFLQQAETVFQERLRLLDFAMDHYRGGLLFFYFGTPDQVGHMFWGARDPDHPAISPEEHEKYKSLMEDIYVRMDDIVGRVSRRFADATLMVMSDHGFCDYRRTVNLNTWLKQQGYARPARSFDTKTPFNFDFSKTRAYAIGLNGLYVNLKGRETAGIVDSTEKQALMDELAARLKAFRDPDTGAPVVKDVYQADRIFSGPMVGVGPDLLVGYAAGYRGGGESALGAFPGEVVVDNKDAWCADHCVATDLVPGILFVNRRVGVDDPDLLDIAPTILKALGVKRPEQMRGRDLFSYTVAGR